ncbi:MAG: response regulator [Candidatus Omnitrophica bacterium]|nr:response regulator [Candidatus Omnitrophota bacterium]
MAKKILIVDDELDTLEVLEKRLSHAGYSVIKADNGKDAVRMAKKEIPDLILLDIAMPDISGAEVSDQLSEDINTKNIPIIFLTCLFTKEDEALQGHEIYGKVFIAKPYNPEDLLKEIKKRIL